MAKRGRPSKVSQVCNFEDTPIKLIKMQDVQFNEDLFVPMKTKTIVDSITANITFLESIYFLPFFKFGAGSYPLLPPKILIG